MPQFNAYVNILPKEEILDPQGKATLSGLHALGHTAVQNARVGKRVRLTVDAPSPEVARQIATETANQLLANLIVEYFSIEVEPAA